MRRLRYARHGRGTNVILRLITEIIRIYIRPLLVVTLPFQSVGCVTKAFILIHLFMELILDIRSRKIGEVAVFILHFFFLRLPEDGDLSLKCVEWFVFLNC
jgi:hypothetical protein